jgi:hypothetical protein
LEGLRVDFFGWAGVVLAATVGAIGTVDFLRRHPVALAVLVFPLLVTAAAVGVLGVGVHARYFLLALPVGYLVGTHGLVVAARSVLQRGMRLAEARAVRVEGALAVLPRGDSAQRSAGVGRHRWPGCPNVCRSVVAVLKFRGARQENDRVEKVRSSDKS